MTLTEPQSIAVIHASRPLRPAELEAFLTALAALLAGRHEVGDGELSRALRDLQRQHFQPPRSTVEAFPGDRSMYRTY